MLGCNTTRSKFQEVIFARDRRLRPRSGRGSEAAAQGGYGQTSYLLQSKVIRLGGKVLHCGEGVSHHLAGHAGIPCLPYWTAIHGSNRPPSLSMDGYGQGKQRTPDEVACVSAALLI